MPTIVQQLDAAFRSATMAAFGIDADPLVSVAQNDKFGDYQSNAAMGLAKLVTERTGQKTNPRQVAEQVRAKLDLGDLAGETSIAGPGFINVRLSPAWLGARVKQSDRDERLGVDKVATPRTVVIDYSGPNIAKEMHVGHLRSTIIGDALANVIDFLQPDRPVIRQSHIGDWGTQFGMLIAYFESQAEAGRLTTPGSFGIDIESVEDFYRKAKKEFDASQEFQQRARATVVKLQTGDPQTLHSWRLIVDLTRAHYLPIYERLKVALTVENERGESFYNPLLPGVVKGLKQAGVAAESEGAVVVQVEGYEAPLIIEKSGGGYLYGTTDLASVRFRVDELRADRIIYTHDSRQAQHFNQVFAAARKAGWAPPGVSLEYAPFGTMLGEDNKPFKTRSGDTVKLKDLLDEAEERGYQLAKSKDDDRVARARERGGGGGADAAPLDDAVLRRVGAQVGIGAVKYSDLAKDRVSDYVFSWDRAMAMDGNTAPYLQYAYARTRAIFRKAKESAGGNLSTAGADVRLEASHELALAKHALRLGEVVELVARELKPHHLCNYLYELATKFSGFYENCPVLSSEEPLRTSRLTLCDLTARTLARGLDLLGIEHPEQM